MKIPMFKYFNLCYQSLPTARCILPTASRATLLRNADSVYISFFCFVRANDR